MVIDPVSPLRMSVPTRAAAAAAPGFADALGQLITSTESSAAGANDAIARMLQGSGDVHDAMIAMQKAEMTLQLTVQVRNKLVQAYQEIMRMSI
jgi:flagellar hook-basal body complex protein FliE